MEGSFDLALAQAIAWCAPRADRADPANCLRSAQLRPPMLAERRFAVSVLLDIRSYADAATKAAAAVQSADDLRGGRLLVYFPDEELSDGAAEAESEGFFDVYNTPPWDAWVALLGDDDGGGPHLVSWVPPLFLDLASAGIRVNPEECIMWLEDADVPLRAWLRERGSIT